MAKSNAIIERFIDPGRTELLHVKHSKLGVCIVEKVYPVNNSSRVIDSNGDWYNVSLSDLTLVD